MADPHPTYSPRGGAHQQRGNLLIDTTATTLRTGYVILAAEPETEAEIVQRARNGDSDAFGRLYEKSLDRVYRYIYFRVTDDDIAEDLTSKVFLKAWESLPRFKAGK